MHSSTHSSQTKTVGPAINFLTSFWFLPQKEQKRDTKKLKIKTFINFGFLCAFFSSLIAIVFFAYKILFWNSFELGIAPIVIGVFFLSSIQICILGIIGQYITFVLEYQKNLPLVIEKERINF